MDELKALASLGLPVIGGILASWISRIHDRRFLKHEVPFRRVDEKVADTLSKLYGRLFFLYRSVGNLMIECAPANNRPSDKVLADIKTARKTFYDTLFIKRLYVPDALFEKVKRVGFKLDAKISEFDMIVEMPPEQGSATRHDAFKKACESLRNEIDPLLLEINAEFKKRIGMAD
jgi:hypothetical protein